MCVHNKCFQVKENKIYREIDLFPVICLFQEGFWPWISIFSTYLVYEEAYQFNIFYELKTWKEKSTSLSNVEYRIFNTS